MQNIHYMRNMHYLQEGCLHEEVESSYMHNIHYMRNMHYLQEGCLLEEVASSYIHDIYYMRNMHYLQEGCLQIPAYIHNIHYMRIYTICNIYKGCLLMRKKIDPAILCATTPSPYPFWFSLFFWEYRTYANVSRNLESWEAYC